MLFKFIAEHIARSAAIKLVRELEGKGIVVEYATSCVDAHEVVLVITGDPTIAKTVRERLWQENNGAYCNMETITEEELDAFL